MKDLTGQSIGRYHIIERLGEGGMAVVYKAFDTRLETNVAIKFIRSEKLVAENVDKTLKRFKIEAQKMAQLTQPNIVPVTDFGEYEEMPYLVMRYMPGGNLKQKMGKPMPYQEAAHLLVPIAGALEFAHRQNIIHRDVKPANILLTLSGEPMLTDFGIAKILSNDEETHDSLTATGVGIGTPEYMSPEQGKGQKIDQRSDVYALGIVFYELVTGRKPFMADTPLAVVIKQVTEPLPRPRKYVPDLPELVERIIFKALAKNPDDRYQSMGEFADAMEKLSFYQKTIELETQGRKPEIKQVETGPKKTEKQNIPLFSPNLPQHQSTYWLKRAPALSGLFVMGFLVLIGIVWMLSQSLKSPNKSALLVPRLMQSQIPSLTATPLPKIAANISPETVSQIVELKSLSQTPISEIAFSPDSKIIAAASSKGIYLYNSQTLEQKAYYPFSATITSLAFLADGRTLAFGLNDFSIGLLDASNGKILRKLTGHSNIITSVAFSPDGKTLASSSEDNTVILWDISNGKVLRILTGHSNVVTDATFSPNGKALATGSWDKSIIISDVASGRSLQTMNGHSDSVTSVAFSPDGNILASGSDDRTIILWDVSGGVILHSMTGQSNITSIAFSPDGKILASGSWDRTIILWDPSSGRALRTLTGYPFSVKSVIFSPDGKMLASIFSDGTIRLWGIT
jgi:eukaryotic-like serine/threonine-protein kinase